MHIFNHPNYNFLRWRWHALAVSWIIILAGIAVIARYGIDWFENSRRAVLAQHAYAVANPGGWRDYGDLIWGLSACDGPMDAAVTSSYFLLRGISSSQPESWRR